MKLIITIDTEEDDWGAYKYSRNALENIKKISVLQKIFEEYKVIPTYLITYSVANNVESAVLFKKILGMGRCEIGAHCHPWSTPPFIERTSERNSMLCNLPSDLQYQKLEILHDTIFKKVGIEPKSFRAGRWGFNAVVADNLCKLGFKVDTSETPYCDWSMYHGPNFSFTAPTPRRLECNQLVEIPPTIGFLQKKQSVANLVLQGLKDSGLKSLRLIGALYRLKLLNLVWLSPELNSADEMIQLSRTLKNLGHEYLNMSFHSTSLLPGKSPFVKDEAGLEAFYEKIRTFLRFTVEQGITSVSLSEAAIRFEAGQAPQPKLVHGQGIRN